LKETIDTVEASVQALQMRYYIDAFGTYLGGWDNGNQPEGAIEVDSAPSWADQPWLFPGWGVSPSVLRQAEVEWQTGEMLIIANQLLAIEEEADDAMPGTRKQWLTYRTGVRLWHESPDFPDSTKRPTRPT